MAGSRSEKPRRRKITGEVQHMGVIPPKLMMDAIAQPDPLFA